MANQFSWASYGSEEELIVLKDQHSILMHIKKQKTTTDNIEQMDIVKESIGRNEKTFETFYLN